MKTDLELYDNVARVVRESLAATKASADVCAKAETILARGREEIETGARKLGEPSPRVSATPGEVLAERDALSTALAEAREVAEEVAGALVMLDDDDLLEPTVRGSVANAIARARGVFGTSQEEEKTP